jgi:succinate dehydrogenase flavin-adding protein (antitoxin of CptAB toxin-antitoxin module)
MKKTKERSQKMLAYSKNVLSKMTFDVLLFKKELFKAYQNLLEEEINELRSWVNDTFGPQYGEKPMLIENVIR